MEGLDIIMFGNWMKRKSISSTIKMDGLDILKGIYQIYQRVEVETEQ